MFDTLPGAMGESAVGSHLLVRPETDLASTRLLPVAPELVQLLPERGLRRGSVVAVSGSRGATSLLLALLAEAMAQGSWIAVVGIPTLGIEAAAGLGLHLDHLVLAPDPTRHWPEVVGALLDAVDVVVLNPPGHPRPSDARRLAARARERGTVLVIKEPIGGERPSSWPEVVDLHLDVVCSNWNGLGLGSGTLGHRQLTARSFGRRGGTREHLAQLWLPDPEGRLRAAPEKPEKPAPILGASR